MTLGEFRGLKMVPFGIKIEFDQQKWLLIQSISNQGEIWPTKGEIWPTKMIPFEIKGKLVNKNGTFWKNGINWLANSVLFEMQVNKNDI